MPNDGSQRTRSHRRSIVSRQGAEEFIAHAESHPGVAFMRKDEIVRFGLES